MNEKIDWGEPVELVDVSSGVAVPTAEPTEYIGRAAGQPHYSHAVLAWCKVYLVSELGEMQHVPEFRIRNVREPQYRPYTPDELAALVGTAVRHKLAGDTTVVLHHTSDDRTWLKLAAQGGSMGCTAKVLLKYYTHLDGTPCGVLVEADDES